MTMSKYHNGILIVASAAMLFLAGCENDVPSSDNSAPSRGQSATSNLPAIDTDRTTLGDSQADSQSLATQGTVPQDTRLVDNRESGNQEQHPLSQSNPSSTAGQATSLSTSESAVQRDSAADHEYEPPFGERVNLFLPAERESPVARKTDRSGGPTIQLKGFAQVERLRAILSLDGRVITLAEGEEKEGIRAVSIQPPQVQLQKGRQRWTLTLSKSLGSSP